MPKSDEIPIHGFSSINTMPFIKATPTLMTLIPVKEPRPLQTSNKLIFLLSQPDCLIISSE